MTNNQWNLHFTSLTNIFGGSDGKNRLAMLEAWVQSLGQEDPLEKEMATHSGILAWKIPSTRSMVGYGLRGHKELNTTE